MWKRVRVLGAGCWQLACSGVPFGKPSQLHPDVVSAPFLYHSPQMALSAFEM